MAKTPDEPLLFGRFSREECGLPPAGPDPFGERLGMLRPVVLLIALAALGWLAGRVMANNREVWVASLPAMLVGESPEKQSELMTRGKMFATALPDDPSMRRNLAIAAMTAADLSPRRAGYYGNARELLANRSAEAVQGEPPIEAFFTWLTMAGLYEEAQDYQTAFTALDRAEKALSLVQDEALLRSCRLHLVNTQAWLLACAPREEGGDPVRSLELANLMITSRDTLLGGRHPSGAAELLDTLAMARFKNGLTQEAVSAQSLALGLADSRGLEVYLRNFDTFRASAATADSSAAGSGAIAPGRDAKK